MCYSVEVQKELKRIAERFNTEILAEHETWYEELKKRANDPKFVKEALNLSRAPKSNFFKEPSADNRIYPGYFTNIIVEENGRRVFKKMRYRVRPAGSATEIPTKYNVFNARIDSLEARDTWRKIFTKNHALLPFTRFFEWVDSNGAKKQISFAPNDKEIMWAPCLYDYWENEKEGFGFYSFAIVTDDPPPEVLENGHDRCPIFLREDQISNWLRPEGKTTTELYEILRKREVTHYLNQWVEAS